MLTGFLTTALEIIIVLDICGAVVYFALSGLTRMNQNPPEGGRQWPLPGSDDGPGPSPLPAHPSGLQPCTVEGPSSPYGSPVPVEGPALSVYAGTPSAPQTEKGFSLTAGLKRRIVSLKDRLTYRPAGNAQAVQTRETGSDYRKLGQVLDSFKEEM